LQSVWADIDHTILSSDTCINELLMWETGWVDVDMGEWMVLNLTRVNMLESTNFLAGGVGLNFSKLPSKVHINAPLGTFFKCDLVGIWEFVDPFVWGPVCDSSGLA